jgi:hypothetical protein
MEQRLASNARIRLTLTARQLDHVIAGLRALQARWYTIDETGQSEAIREIACEHGELMTPEEIDSFIEVIN